jgi:hypothetical protein
MQVEIANQVALAKSDMKRQMEKEFEDRQAQQKSVYKQDDSFARFTLSYPSSWLTDHSTNGLKFYSSDNTKWFAFAQIKHAAAISSDKISTTTWNGYPAKVYEDQNQGRDEKVMDVYPDGYARSKFVVEIYGSKDDFDTLASGITDFKINK